MKKPFLGRGVCAMSGQSMKRSRASADHTRPDPRVSALPRSYRLSRLLVTFSLQHCKVFFFLPATAEKLSVILLRWLTKIFVTGHIVSFTLQAGGGGIQSAGTLDLYEMGERIIIAGLFVQIVILGLFMITTVIWHSRISSQPLQTEGVRSCGLDTAFLSSLLNQRAHPGAEYLPRHGISARQRWIPGFS
ncbi:hypothetical protein ACJZ2D_007096 [Fusarium nematophilum]